MAIDPSPPLLPSPNPGPTPCALDPHEVVSRPPLSPSSPRLAPSSLLIAPASLEMLGKHARSPSSLSPPNLQEELAKGLVPGPPSQQWTADSLKTYRSSLKRLRKEGKCPQASVSSTPPRVPSPSLPPTDPFLVQAQELILPLTFKNHIASKEHLVNQARQMLVDGNSLASIKVLISNLVVLSPPTPTQQLELDALYNKGTKKFTESGSHLR